MHELPSRNGFEMGVATAKCLIGLRFPQHLLEITRCLPVDFSLNPLFEFLRIANHE